MYIFLENLNFNFLLFIFVTTITLLLIKTYKPLKINSEYYASIKLLSLEKIRTNQFKKLNKSLLHKRNSISLDLIPVRHVLQI